MKNGQYLGYLQIEDRIKDDSISAIEQLKKIGVLQVIMLTGDRKNTAEKVAKKLKLDKYFAELLPMDKVNKLEELLAEKTPDGKVLFVGDGINDAPVLARSDIGIAMGGLGADAARAHRIEYCNHRNSDICKHGCPNRSRAKCAQPQNRKFYRQNKHHIFMHQT